MGLPGESESTQVHVARRAAPWQVSEVSEMLRIDVVRMGVSSCLAVAIALCTPSYGQEPTPAPPLAGPTGGARSQGKPTEPVSDAHGNGATASSFQGGVCWVGSADDASLRYLHDHGVRWISVTPFGYGQQEANKPPADGYKFSRHRGESIEEVREVIRRARGRSLKVMLKPHLWFSGGWCGDIRMQTPEDWQRWFEAYRAFLSPFIDVAREEQVEILCLGTELGGTIEQPGWLDLITEARTRYPGKLTYAANWYGDYDRVPFWTKLDFIGVQAYFPLTDKNDPSIEELAAGWERWKAEIASVAAQAKRPILLTEFGYKPVLGTTIRPWEWRSHEPFSAEAQARAYEAAFSALRTEEWFRGAYVWKWFSGYTGGELRTRRRTDNFSPQGLPAEQVMRRWFRELQGLAPAPRVGEF